MRKKILGMLISAALLCSSMQCLPVLSASAEATTITAADAEPGTEDDEIEDDNNKDDDNNTEDDDSKKDGKDDSNDSKEDDDKNDSDDSKEDDDKNDSGDGKEDDDKDNDSEDDKEDNKDDDSDNDKEDNKDDEKEDETPVAEHKGNLLETTVHRTYISGYPDGSFGPEKYITRAESAAMFYGLLKDQTAGSTGNFADVSADAWFAKSVNTLAALGIVEGHGNGRFEPDSYITRAEFAAIISKFAEARSGENRFSDVADTHWGYSGICSVSIHGWANGYADGTFRPEQNITRAECVIMVNGMLGRACDSGAANYKSTKRFSDVKTDYWGFVNICEAATAHDYTVDSENHELWDVDENALYEWEAADGGWKYRNVTKDYYVSGFRYMDGLTYYFDPGTQLLITGWQEINGLHYLLPEKDEAVQTMDIKQNLTNINSRKSNRSSEDIKYIIVHYTGVPNFSSAAWAVHFKNEYRAASAHYFVDQTETWQVVPTKDVSWHVGTSGTYFHETARNENAIGIEMSCEKTDPNTAGATGMEPDWYYRPETERNTAELVRYLMKVYNVPIENLIRHYDVTHKICPSPYMTNHANWQNFMSLVTEEKISYDGDYTATVIRDGVGIFSAPNAGSRVIGTKSRSDTFTVYEERAMGRRTSDLWVRIGEDQWLPMQDIVRK